ncbi:MAG: SRPBCC domain-containing protein [Chitinophagaceae bacterium]
MNTQPIVIERVYNAALDTVWKAITNRDDMKQWFFDIAAFKPEVGFEFEFYGEGKNGEKYLHLCKVTEVVPLKKLSYSWRYQGIEGISQLSFELFSEGDQTRLKLTHTGVDSFKTDSPDFAPGSFVEGWTYITGISLKEFLEKK